MPNALIVEDDEDALYAIADIVEDRGFSARTATTIDEARAEIRTNRFDVALLDVVLPGGNGLDLLLDLSGANRPHIVLMSGDTSIDSALRGLPFESLDYLNKPVDVTRLKNLLNDIRRRVTAASDAATEGPDFGSIVGKSPQMQRVFDLVAKVAPTDATVLIIGESGTGKELVAEAVHRSSPRRDAPLVALNCGAIPENLIDSELFGHEKGSFTGANRSHAGVFEQARGGTLFLDEITEMPMELQVRLLRVLETRQLRRVGGSRNIEVDCRVVAATNRLPQTAVEQGKLREDLMYRLSVFSITLPPLRQREGDVVVLAQSFLERLNQQHGTAKRLTEDALELLESFHWPGNVRQLKNAVHHAYIVAGDAVDAEHLPAQFRKRGTPAQGGEGPEPGTTIAEAERRLIESTLKHFGGNKEKTARALGVSLRTLYNRLNAYVDQDKRRPDEPPPG